MGVGEAVTISGVLFTAVQWLAGLLVAMAIAVTFSYLVGRAFSVAVYRSKKEYDNQKHSE